MKLVILNNVHPYSDFGEREGVKKGRYFARPLSPAFVLM